MAEELRLATHTLVGECAAATSAECAAATGLVR